MCSSKKSVVSCYKNIIAVKSKCNRKLFASWDVNETLVRKAQKQTCENSFLFLFSFFPPLSQELSFSRLFREPMGEVRWEQHGKLGFPLPSDAICPHFCSWAGRSWDLLMNPESPLLDCCFIKDFLMKIWRKKNTERGNIMLIVLNYFF